MSAIKPADILDAGGPHAGAVTPLSVALESPRNRRQPRSRPWDMVQTASDFLSAPETDVEFLEPRMLARGSMSMVISPRGLGKTHVAHAMAVKLAREGLRVLIIDRDNSRRELKRRLGGWGAKGLTTLHVMTRDDAPPLTDHQAWSDFPAKYDLVVIDSFDSSTEGIGEQDSAKPSLALAPLLDIVHTADGPAVLLLANTVKSGKHGRGSGVIEDRADIVFEVRDATDLKPSGEKDWWLELPAADRGSWGDRASRRKKRESYRLAFVPSKFRVGEEPDPFVLEVCLPAEHWKCQDVTEDLVTEGAQMSDQAAREESARSARGAEALSLEVAMRASAGDPMRKREEAEEFLGALGVSRRQARALIADRDGSDWRIAGGARKGDPEVLLPLSVGAWHEDAAGIKPIAEPRQMRVDEQTMPAAQEHCAPQELGFIEPAPDAAEPEAELRPLELLVPSLAEARGAVEGANGMPCMGSEDASIDYAPLTEGDGGAVAQPSEFFPAEADVVTASDVLETPLESCRCTNSPLVLTWGIRRICTSCHRAVQQTQGDLREGLALTDEDQL